MKDSVTSAVIEVGTSSTVVMVGSYSDSGLLVRGIARVPTSGMRKGRVVTKTNVEECVRTAINNIKDEHNFDVIDVNLVCSLGDIGGDVCSVSSIVPQEAGCVTEEIKSTLSENIAKAHIGDSSRTTIAKVHLYYTVDNSSDHIDDPTEMSARQVSSHALIVHTDARALDILYRTVENAGVDVGNGGINFSAMCGAYRGLSPQQKQDGALFIDFGGGTISWCGYRDNHPICVGALPIGGDHVTNDLMAAFHPGSTSTAERLKCESAQAVLAGIDPTARIPIPAELGSSSRTVSARSIAIVANARMEETLQFLRTRIKEHLPNFGAGVVIAGGAARLAKLNELVAQVLGLPCSRVKTPEIRCANEKEKRILQTDYDIYATAYGALYMCAKRDFNEMRSKSKRGLMSRMRKFFYGQDGEETR